MTKFEEDLNEKLNSEKVPMYITQNRCSLTRKTFIETNWLFANYGNYHSDEEFQELLDKYSNLNDNYEKEVIRSSKLESQIIDLKSQLKQQALPVVPECVANFLSGKSIFKIANGDIPDDVISWVQEQTYYVDLEKIISHLISLKVTGFTVAVEKPQLFYLKHIDMSKHSRYFDFYLEYDGNESMEHKRVDKGEKPGTGYEKSCYTFTQQEINSMETGSYEQIEVEE